MRAFWLSSALLLAALLAAQSTGQRKSGLPDPPKKDIPYLIHADQLLETETGEAKEEKRGNEQIFVLAGAASPAKTPLAGPEFLLLSDQVQPDKLQLYRVEPKGGRREVITARKNKPVARPLFLSVIRVHQNLFKIRVDESLAAGQYCLTPSGSNAVFCFAVE